MPEKKALMVIDIISFCCDEEYEIKKWGIAYSKIRKMVPNLISFRDEFKKKAIGPVIYIRCVKWDKEHVAHNIRELYKNPNADFYTRDKAGLSEEFYKINPDKNDYTITKNTYDAFSNPELEKLLKKLDIKHLVVTGVLGDGCVNATLQSGFSRGYSFTIIKDLIETMDNPERQKLQNLLKKHTWPLMIGKTISSKKFLDS